MRCLPLVLLILLTGCADVAEVVLVGNQGPRIEVIAREATEPELLDFGDVQHGSQASVTLLIRNLGGEPLEIGAVNLSQSDFLDISDIRGLPGRLDPGASVDFDVVFNPPYDVHLESELTVSSSDPERPEVQVAIVGEGHAPTLRIEPDNFQFGTGVVGCDETLEVTLTNVGRAPLVLDEVTLTEDTGGQTFSLELEPTLGTEIAPGESVSSRIRWVSDDHLPDSASLQVRSNDPQGDKTATFAGSSLENDPVFDAWTADGSLELTLLFVVDVNDPDVRAELAAASVELFDMLLGVGFDARVAVLDGGGVFGAVDVLGAAPVVEFAALVGAAGSPTGRSLDATVDCFASGPCASGLPRSWADLHVVFVTDGAESSTALPTLGDYAATLRALRPVDVFLSAISGGGLGCSGVDVVAPPDGGLSTLSVGAGVPAEVCAQGWGDTLVQMARLSVPALDRFILTESPAEPTIEVSVDGALRTDWTFMGADNAVVFAPGAYPAVGDAVEVEYRMLACE
jgi:hypothetical protein